MVRRRGSLRLRGYEYSTPGAYFVTVRTRQRERTLGRVMDGHFEPSRLAAIVESCWFRLPNHFAGVELDAFAILPDHVHGILLLGRAGQAPPPHQVVGAFKSCSSRLARVALWQRGYHDRVIRNERELAALRHYVVHNALKPRRL